MADAALVDLLDQVRPECGGAPTDLMVQQLRNVIRDFCQYTRAWAYEAENQTILQLVSDYDIELPNTQAYPIAIEYLSVDGTPASFVTTAWLDQNRVNWRNRDSDDFTIFTQIQPKVITFPGKPTATGTIGGLYYRVSLKPTQEAEDVDADLAEEWLDTWSCGTKAALLAMEGRMWYKPKRAMQLEAYYRAERGKAKIRIARSRGNACETWVGPRFA